MISARKQNIAVALALILLAYYLLAAGCENVLRLSFTDPDDIETLADPNNIITPPDAHETQP